jgi:hypothetical protein
VTGALAGHLALGLAFAAAGAVVVRGGGGHLGACTALVGLLLVAAATVTAAGAPRWGDGLWALAVFVAPPVALLVHPDGRPPRPGGGTLLGVAGATGLLALVDPAGFRTTDIAPVALAVLVVAGIWWRHEHAEDRERRALLWLLLGLGSAALVALPTEFLLGEGPAHDAVVTLCWLAVPVALVAGARYPERGDVRALIARGGARRERVDLRRGLRRCRLGDRAHRGVGVRRGHGGGRGAVRGGVRAAGGAAARGGGPHALR